MEVKMRWMIRSDLDKVKRMNYLDEYSLNEFVNKPNSICHVAELDGSIVGYLFYEISPKCPIIKVSSLFVEPSYRRRGVGTSMILKLLSKMIRGKNTIEFLVSEYDLEAHLFLKSNGFKAVSVIRGPEFSSYEFLRKMRSK
jgi:GNAT superfamily N-acetyltransferase